MTREDWAVTLFFAALAIVMVYCFAALLMGWQ